MSTQIPEPPTTGDEVLDEALAKVAALGEDLSEYPQVLRDAFDALTGLLREE